MCGRTDVRIALGQHLLAEVYQHASQCYPAECCGFIRASGRVHRAVNDQDRLHRDDPIGFPRDSRNAYAFSPRDLLILNDALFSSDPPVVIYHSHPDVGAYFSEYDAKIAVHDGRLIYDVDFLVIDACKNGTRGAKLFRYVSNRFDCIWCKAAVATPES